MDDRVPDLMTRPDVDQVDLRTVEVQLVAYVKQGRRQDQLDAVEVIGLRPGFFKSYIARIVAYYPRPVSARLPYFSSFSRREPSRSWCHPYTNVNMNESMRRSLDRCR